jgi:hypothetical protein
VYQARTAKKQKNRLESGNVIDARKLPTHPKQQQWEHRTAKNNKT